MSDGTGGARPDRAVLIFVDGLGVGSDDAEANPVAAAAMPEFTRLFGSAPLSGAAGQTPRAGWVPADARLGVEGLPQSGTGQTTLLTGVNAARWIGRHFGPWVPTELRPLLSERSIFRRVVDAGGKAAFANATPARHAEGKDGRWRRPAAPPLAAHAAGLRRRDASELRARRAIASSITNEKWQAHVDPSTADISPADAGHVLAEISATADFTLFAHYDLDYLGHRGSHEEAITALQRLDAFIGAAARAMPGALIVIASDHGNVETIEKGHTINPVPIAATGPGAEGIIGSVRSIADVTPSILKAMGIEG